MANTIAHLKSQFPNNGTVEWIGTRKERNTPVKQVFSVLAINDRGLEGDRSSLSKGGKRQVTLFQAEYLAVLSSLHTQSSIDYADLRRNIAISGLNLNILENEHLSIGEATFEITGLCHPCGKMETQLGVGAYNALRGHGGLTAKIIKGGLITVGDEVELVTIQQNLL